jgi:hypothetical protein
MPDRALVKRPPERKVKAGLPQSAYHLITGTLPRSMVSATAPIRTAPKIICSAKISTPTKVMPMRTIDTVSAPTAVRPMPPSPPVIAVPPTMTDAIAGRSSWFARLGEPLESRAARIVPASAPEVRSPQRP